MKYILQSVLCVFLILPANGISEIKNDSYMGVEDCFVGSDNIQLFCRIVGNGNPIIVVHGGPCLDHNYLFPQMSALGQTNRIIFYDQRGCGRSVCDINSTLINVQTFMDDIESIRKAFGYGKITILGHSWGGFLAMSFAIAHPEAINKLILLNTMPASSEEFSLFATEVVQRLAPYQKEIDALERSTKFLAGDPATIETYYRIYFRTYCYDPRTADLLNLFMTPEASVHGIQVDKIFTHDLFGSYSIHDQLTTIKAPTLIIHGDSDPIPPSFARKIHEEIQGSLYVELKNCGHFPYVETPQELFCVLNEFLQK